jgi:hypothetical protein
MMETVVVSGGGMLLPNSGLSSQGAAATSFSSAGASAVVTTHQAREISTHEQTNIVQVTAVVSVGGDKVQDELDNHIISISDNQQPNQRKRKLIGDEFYAGDDEIGADNDHIKVSVTEVIQAVRPRNQVTELPRPPQAELPRPPQAELPRPPQVQLPRPPLPELSRPSVVEGSKLIVTAGNKVLINSPTNGVITTNNIFGELNGHHHQVVTTG